uniref:CUB domain-containing protein n=1 Tax=Tetranychus urticae TaxID=32264 RepID=T1K507_TETUR
MFYFLVILISLASLSAVQAIDECGVPKHYFSIDEFGFTDCGSSCVATVIFSGYRKLNAEYVTIDMIANYTEPNDTMTLSFFYKNKSYDLHCNKLTSKRYAVYYKDGLKCNYKLQLSGNEKRPISNFTLLSELLVDEKINNDIYFGFNGNRAQVASSLTSLIPYHESFPDCSEYDVLTFYDPQGLNKITLSKQKDSITGFIYSLKKDDKPENRSITFSHVDDIKLAVECKRSFQGQSCHLDQYGEIDHTADVEWPKFTIVADKCAFSVPLKVLSRGYGNYFDFNKKPLNMAFNTTQPNASFYQPNIEFKFN